MYGRRVGGPQDPVDVQRACRARGFEALGGDDLEGLAGPDALLDVLDGVLEVRAAPQRGVLGQLGGRQRGGGWATRPREVGLHGVEAGDGVGVRLVDAGVEVVVVDRVGDQQDGAVPVVQDGEVQVSSMVSSGSLRSSRSPGPIFSRRRTMS